MSVEPGRRCWKPTKRMRRARMIELVLSVVNKTGLNRALIRVANLCLREPF